MNKEEIGRRIHKLKVYKMFARQWITGIMTTQSIERIADSMWKLELLISKKKHVE